MQDILGQALEKLRRKRIRRTRMLAVLLVLSLLVSTDVFWSLRQPGLTLAGDADCRIVEHIHDEQCQNENTKCQLEEHSHTVECYSDDTADLESQVDWQKMFEDYPFTSDIAKDLVGIAKTQVGYTESKLNFQVDQNGVRHGYTRYGAWYGVPYGEWSATFVAFCLNYAGADPNEYPINTGADSMAEQWKALGKFVAAGEHKPLSGDLVFFKDNTVGIIATAKSTTCYVICGDTEDKVQTKLISLTDPSVSGFGTLIKRSTYNPLYDTSNGPVGIITATDTKTETAQTYTPKKAQTYNLRTTQTAEITETAQDLITYLNKIGGNYYFSLSDTSEHSVPKDENGNFIVHAETIYKLGISIVSADGFTKGTYQYRLPEGVNIVSVSDGPKDLVLDGDTVGAWSVDKTGLIEITFNQKVNNLSDVALSMIIDISIPREQTEIDFDGKINMTVEPPREEIKTTEVQKWGLVGSPDNANNPNHAYKLDETKIYWSAVIEGNQNSNIVGSVIIDQMIDDGVTYEYTYTESDKAAGIKFGVTIYDPDTGSETWHAWTVYEGDPNLTWGENGWSYRVPETVICNKNTNSPHELVLGNDNYTYHIDYTATPTHVDVAGYLDYANRVTVDNNSSVGWVTFSHGDVHAAVYKNGTLVTDADGAKILWEIKATIPKKSEQRAHRDWTISDSIGAYTNGGTWVDLADNIIGIKSFTANYFGTQINVPYLWEATGNEPYAYEMYTWKYGAEIRILQRCACTPETCGENAGTCNPWAYNFCDCWNEIEDTTFTITYETDVTDELEQYGGLNSFVKNGAGLTSLNFDGNTSTQLYVNEYVTLPGIIQKTDTPRDGTIVNYSITVNEAKLNLTNGGPLVILDEMTPTLAFMRGSLVITSIDALGNEVVLEEGVDYVYDYNNHEDIGEVHDKHVLKITIENAQPVTYRLDYRTSIIMPTIENYKPVNYVNTASISLWNGSASDTSTEYSFPDVQFSSNKYSVFVHKYKAGDIDYPLQGATFGLFNDQGGLITESTTDENGRAYFKTDVENGIVLREHKIYYVKELVAPPGYQLDETIHEFTFCSNADGTCDTYNDLKEEHDLTRVPFEEEGHIDVPNELISYNLPSTGGIGIYPLLLASVILIVTPLVYIFAQKRKRKGKVTDNFPCFASAKKAKKQIKKGRKKIMKKLASIFLALAMILAISIPAFAADTQVTIGTAGREYKGYQLMTLTTSLKCGDDTHEHVDACYNYAYSIKDEYLQILKDVTGKGSEAEIIKYLATEVQSNTPAMQGIADNIYRAIIAAGTFTPKAFAGATPTDVEQGYWIFADVTDLKGEEEKANSVVMVDTKGQGELTVNPKEGLPSVTKEVKDATTGAWGEAADARIGQDVEFKLTATVHNRLASYETYKLEFQDNFDGYTLKEDSIVVKMYADNTKDEATAVTLVEDRDYTVTTGTNPDFKVVINDIKALNATASSVFEVAYTAELAEGADIGEPGNPNTVTLVFSNNPYDATSTGTTSDNVVVYTYKLTIEKRALAEDGALLPGAAFSLYKMVDGAETLIGEYTADGRTTFEWLGLDDGDYILKEDVAPEGYNKMADLNFTIAATYDIDGIDTLTVAGMVTDADNGTISDVVVNLTGTVLPETGGMGTMWLIFGGAMLVILAGVFMITRKKMSVYAD